MKKYNLEDFTDSLVMGLWRSCAIVYMLMLFCNVHLHIEINKQYKYIIKQQEQTNIKYQKIIDKNKFYLKYTSIVYVNGKPFLIQQYKE